MLTRPLFQKKINKSQTTITATVLLFFSLIFLSCNKNISSISVDPNKNFNIEEFSKELMTDSSFINFVINFGISQNVIVNNSSFDASKDNGIAHTNQELVKNHVSLIQLHFSKFANSNKKFFLLTTANQQKVLLHIQNLYASKSFRDKNPHLALPLLNANNFIINKINTSNLDSSNHYRMDGITSNELMGCVLGAIGGFIGSYADAVSDIRYLITQGWTGAALIDAALSIVKHASPWWKVASIGISFGGCLLGVAD